MYVLSLKMVSGMPERGAILVSAKPTDLILAVNETWPLSPWICVQTSCLMVRLPQCCLLSFHSRNGMTERQPTEYPQSILLVMQEANSYESRLGRTTLTVRRKKRKEKRNEEFMCKIKHKAHQQVKHNSQCFHTALLLLFYVHSASCFIHKRSLLTPSIYKP